VKKIHRSKDPHLQREANKYEYPLPSREFIADYLRDHGRPVTHKRLVEIFDIQPIESEAFRRRLIAMCRDGQLISNRRGSYALVEQMDLVAGRVVGHKDGFGFLISDKEGPDIFLSPRQMPQVFPGDRILVRVSGLNERGRQEGHIVEILERNSDQFVGRFYQENGVAFVTPENKNITQDIIIPPGESAGAKPGQFVVVVITAFPTLRRQASGKITEILGEHMAPGMEIEVVIRSYNLPHHWSDEVNQEIKQLQQDVTEKDRAGRKDLRHLAFVTIDGEDAKDFDDAVYCEQKPKGWRLSVAIADVSYYVKPGQNLDTEASTRGNSV